MKMGIKKWKVFIKKIYQRAYGNGGGQMAI
jgi:hypothetical protein